SLGRHANLQSAVLHHSAHCGSEPAGHHLYLPLQARIIFVLIFSHLRQLYTSTNLLLLSLAVADFVVGLLQMPVILLQNQGCWILGDLMCAVHYFLGFLIVSVSVGNMVLISVDRYIAICDPMFYSTKVTMKRVQYCVYLCWVFSAVHSSWILRDFLKQPNRFNSCYGDCVVVVSFARAMRSHVAAVTLQRSQTVKAKKSEIKAARTLGVVVAVFLLCNSPYYCFAVAAESNLVGASSAPIEIWLVYFNSCLNPVIYVFFYPWFRKSIKKIVTLKILQSAK
uniref:G-protein coupled receptors family 1 profile domain-containing protein n=1 Tax=Seriola lalandi dorsalis TaxID=1841481 RepID=A0A3B4W963_SERLL